MQKTKFSIETAGLYIHIPFCIKKCPYCDFYSVTDQTLQEDYLEKLLLEMRMVSTETLFFDTVYLGGGTPSVFTPQMIGRIMNAAHKYFRIKQNSENSMEVNPGTVTSRQLKDYRKAGINRLIIGVQSFHDVELQFLGRIHSAKEAVRVVQQARNSGYENVGIDLMYGLPGQTSDAWLKVMKKAVEMEPEHMSCYMLTYEKGTRTEKDLRTGVFKPLFEQLIADLFELTYNFLTDSGYMHYEISNFAKALTGISKHNSKYWSFLPYLGLGASAHSFADPVRSWNVRSVKQYISLVGDERLPVEDKEKLNRKQRLIESIFVGLRKSEGIDIDQLNRRCNSDFMLLFGNVVSDLEENGLLKLLSNHITLTWKGMLLLDSVVSTFMNQELFND